MVKQGVHAPSRMELEILKKYQQIEKCPFCGRSLGEMDEMKLKAYKMWKVYKKFCSQNNSLVAEK